MTRRLPEDAFALYVALGADRSHEAVAKHFGVSKKTVSRAAEREDWSSRLQSIERKSRAATDEKLADEMHAMNMRHRKMLLAIAARAAAAIQAHPISSAMDGVRAAEVAIKLERLIAGEPTESRAVSVERITRDEVKRFLCRNDEDEWEDESEDEPGQGDEVEAELGTAPE